MPDFSIEEGVKSKGFDLVCGVDEAGRGPLAGPVCAAAVILSDDFVNDSINDSKKLTEKKREELYDIITKNAISYGVAFATVDEIEEYNILNATFLAMNRAIDGLLLKPQFALIDGNRKPTGIKVPCQTIIKGDSLSLSISAASILAKVTRDRLMYEYDKEMPQYCFAKHKGYGTKLHYEMIEKYGPCKYHRVSFLKSFFNKR